MSSDVENTSNRNEFPLKVSGLSLRDGVRSSEGARRRELHLHKESQLRSLSPYGRRHRGRPQTR